MFIGLAHRLVDAGALGEPVAVGRVRGQVLEQAELVPDRREDDRRGAGKSPITLPMNSSANVGRCGLPAVPPAAVAASLVAISFGTCDARHFEAGHNRFVDVA